MNKLTFFKKDKSGKIISTASSIDIYIPRSYFDENIAEIIGSKLSVLGIFKFNVALSEGGSETSYLMNFPNQITISFSSQYNKKAAFDGAEDSFIVFNLEKDDIFMESETIVPTAKNVEKFAKLLHAGKLPKTSYEAIYHQYIQVQLDNNASLRVPSTTIESIIAELTRSEKDISKPFRLSSDPKGKGFKLINLKQLPQLISTFSGVSFENIDNAITTSIVRKRQDKPNLITPMEETIKY